MKKTTVNKYMGLAFGAVTAFAGLIATAHITGQSVQKISFANDICEEEEEYDIPVFGDLDPDSVSGWYQMTDNNTGITYDGYTFYTDDDDKRLLMVCDVDTGNVVGMQIIDSTNTTGFNSPVYYEMNQIIGRLS